MLEKVHGKLREKLRLDKVPGEVHEKMMLNKYLGKCAVNLCWKKCLVNYMEN